MKRLLLKIIGVVLVVGALVMLGMFWGDAHSGISPTYRAEVQHKATESLALVQTLQAQNAPATSSTPRWRTLPRPRRS